MVLLTVLRVVGLLEGLSYLGLGITMYMKYQLDMPLANKIVGMAHGIFFILYCMLVFYVGDSARWSKKTTGLALLASLIPFGTFVAEAKIFKPTAERFRSIDGDSIHA